MPGSPRFGFLFVSIDKLFRLRAGIRAFRSGWEFLNKTDGYLQYGNLAESLDKLADIPEAEWGTILAVPESARILEELTRRSASESKVATKLEFGRDLPRQMAQFAGQMRDETSRRLRRSRAPGARRSIRGRSITGAPLAFRRNGLRVKRCAPGERSSRPLLVPARAPAE